MPPIDPGFYTTPEQVRSINPSIDEDVDLTPFIATAHALVFNTIIANGCGASYPLSHLALIEAWLAAHFHQVQDGVITGEGAGTANQSFSVNQDTFLMNTMFGQQAMLLDFNGCLANLLGELEDAKTGKKRKRVGLFWLGRNNPIQNQY
jgi:hypothetical protein